MFWFSTFCGIFAVSVIHTTIGEKLDQMTSADDFNLISFRNFLLLAGVCVAVLLPVAVRRFVRPEVPAEDVEADGEGTERANEHRQTSALIGRGRGRGGGDGEDEDEDAEWDDELPAVNRRVLDRDTAGEVDDNTAAWQAGEADADADADADSGRRGDEWGSDEEAPMVVKVHHGNANGNGRGDRRPSHGGSQRGNKAARVLGIRRTSGGATTGARAEEQQQGGQGGDVMGRAIAMWNSVMGRSRGS